MSPLLNFHLGFRPPSAPSLHDLSGQGYYLHSPSLWGVTPQGESACLRLIEGVPWRFYPALGWRINPAHLAWWGLINLNLWLETGREEHLERAGAVKDWLRAAKVPWGAGLAWTYDFPWPHGALTLSPPWVSGLAQALAAGFLWRAAPIFREPDLAGLAESALALYEVPLEQGGLRTSLNGQTFFEEYPIQPCTYVLDGFLFALLVFHDQKLFSGRRALWDQGMACLLANLDYWDWRGCWSRYGNFGYLCSVEYHLLNLTLLEALARLSGRGELEELVRRWSAFKDSPRSRAAIALAYYAGNVRYTLGDAGVLKQFLRRKLAPHQRSKLS